MLQKGVSSILGGQCINTLLLSTVVLLQIAIDEKDQDAKELLKKELWYVVINKMQL